MNTYNLYQLPEEEIGDLVKSLKRKPKKKESMINESSRLINNLTALMSSFPGSATEKKNEIKLVVSKLKRLVSSLSS